MQERGHVLTLHRVHAADPYCSCQRGSSENRNGAYLPLPAQEGRLRRSVGCGSEDHRRRHHHEDPELNEIWYWELGKLMPRTSHPKTGVALTNWIRIPCSGLCRGEILQLHPQGQQGSRFSCMRNVPVKAWAMDSSIFWYVGHRFRWSTRCTNHPSTSGRRPDTRAMLFSIGLPASLPARRENIVTKRRRGILCLS